MPEGSILIVRHAESLSNAGQRTSDPASIPITARGEQQARSVAAAMPWRPELVVTSRYVRTIETAQPVLARYPGVPAEVWPVEEFTYLDPRACRDTTFDERTALREAYWRRADPDWVDGEGCESFAHFMARVAEFEKRLLSPEADRIAVFTHGWVMQALVWRQGGDRGRDMRAFEEFAIGTPIPNCARLEAVKEDHRLRIWCVADGA